MERKQIYIDRNDDERLKGWASRKGVSEASLIREAIGQYLVKLEQQEADKSGEVNPLIKLIGMHKGEIPRDLALHHDRYLQIGDEDK
ncbi:MAG TPA: hypothetical protein GX509_01880 [Firmicutes bacterium]|nr:hypothetical protein [Bacillota bacterium]HHY97468.1 hypothetical protein [Bacillota bacterium]